MKNNKEEVNEIMTRSEFFNLVFEMVKVDGNYWNVICQIIHDYDLNATEIGEWVKEDVPMTQNIANERSLYRKRHKSVHDLI